MTKAVSSVYAFSIYALSDGLSGMPGLAIRLSTRPAGTMYPIARRLDTWNELVLPGRARFLSRYLPEGCLALRLAGFAGARSLRIDEWMRFV